MIAAISEATAVSDASKITNGCITKRQCICCIPQRLINVPGVKAVNPETSTAPIQMPLLIFLSGINKAAKDNTVRSAPNAVIITCAQWQGMILDSSVTGHAENNVKEPTRINKLNTSKTTIYIPSE